MQQFATDRMVAQRYWWMFAIRGLIAIIFGLAAITWPHLTLLALVLLMPELKSVHPFSLSVIAED